MPASQQIKKARETEIRFLLHRTHASSRDTPPRRSPQSPASRAPHGTVHISVANPSTAPPHGPVASGPAWPREGGRAWLSSSRSFLLVPFWACVTGPRAALRANRRRLGASCVEVEVRVSPAYAAWRAERPGSLRLGRGGIRDAGGVDLAQIGELLDDGGGPSGRPPRRRRARWCCRVCLYRVVNTAGSKPEAIKPMPARTTPAATSPPATAR